MQINLVINKLRLKQIILKKLDLLLEILNRKGGNYQKNIQTLTNEDTLGTLIVEVVEQLVHLERKYPSLIAIHPYLKDSQR